MSVSLLRHNILSRSRCITCLRPHRCYTAVALAHTSQPGNETQREGPSAAAKKTSKEKSNTDLIRRSPLEPTRVDKYLASIHAAGLEPTINDVEQCRPLKHSRPDSPQYADEYNNLVDTLCRSFSKDQLRQFTILYKLDPIWTTSKRRKAEYAESVIEKQWKWPSLKEIERQRRDKTEVTVKSFNVNPSQLFLILGQDGADLLQLSMQYNVHISLTSGPLALRVEGLRGSLKKLSEHISLLKRDILEETIELPVTRPIKHELLQRISRLANAYVENVGLKGKVRICAKNQNNLITAKRLATRAACELDDSQPTSLLCYTLPKFQRAVATPIAMIPQTYSVYPYLSPRSLPWTMNSGGTFRIRRVGEWLGVDGTEDVQKTGGLVGGQGTFLSKLGEPDSLVELLSRNLPDEKEGYHRLLTASLGHALIEAPTSSSSRSNIVPPLKGYWVLPKILKWLQSSTHKISFVPSLPAPLLKSQPTEQKILHRLLYKQLTVLRDVGQGERAADAQSVVVFEMEIIRPNKGETVYESRSINNLDDFELDPAEELRWDLTMEASNEPSKLDFTSESTGVQCIEGQETIVHLLMPDRPMDLRFSIFNRRTVLWDNQPDDLRRYASALRSFLNSSAAAMDQPRPPLILHHDSKVYLLQSSHSIRQGCESLSLSPLSQSMLNENDETADAQISSVISESVLDLESNQKSTVCQVRCDKHMDKRSWNQFLGSCDALTSATFQSDNVDAEFNLKYTVAQI